MREEPTPPQSAPADSSIVLSLPESERALVSSPPPMDLPLTNT